jgi:cobalt-zinc-cadmium efflux system protein
VRGQNRRRLAVVLALTTGYMAVEVVGGLLTHSLALLADAGHMLTDAGGLALALFALYIAERPATPARTYGYYRAEILAALANAVLLIGLSLYILFESYQRFRHPAPVQSLPMLGIAALGMLVNLAGMFVLHSGANQSLNIRGAYFEVLSDLLTSLAVIVAAIIIWATGWYSVDALLSAGIGLFVLPRTIALLRDAVNVLLEGTPADVNLPALRDALGRLPGVAAIHDLHVWSITSGMHAMSVHAVLEGGAAHDAVLEAVRSVAASDFRIGHVTVQVESRCCAPSETHC